mgnify:CR=1 FL=1
MTFLVVSKFLLLPTSYTSRRHIRVELLQVTYFRIVHLAAEIVLVLARLRQLVMSIPPIKVLVDPACKGVINGGPMEQDQAITVTLHVLNGSTRNES